MARLAEAAYAQAEALLRSGRIAEATPIDHRLSRRPGGFAPTLAATNLAGEFARDGVQIFGGYGFTKELAHDGSHYRVEEVYRDCKIAEIYEGANEIQKWVIAPDLRKRIDGLRTSNWFRTA